MNKNIALLAATLALAGCTSTQTSQPIDLNGRWVIKEVMDLSTQNAEETPFINFEADSLVNGNTSVNSFFGTYKLSGQQLQFSNMGMTKRMGMSMEIEDAVTTALNMTASVQLSDDQLLLLTTNNDVVMTLVKE